MLLCCVIVRTRAMRADAYVFGENCAQTLLPCGVALVAAVWDRERTKKENININNNKNSKQRNFVYKRLSRHIRHEEIFNGKDGTVTLLLLICASAQLDKMPHAHYNITSFCWEDAHLWHPLRSPIYACCVVFFRLRTMVSVTFHIHTTEIEREKMNEKNTFYARIICSRHVSQHSSLFTLQIFLILYCYCSCCCLRYIYCFLFMLFRTLTLCVSCVMSLYFLWLLLLCKFEKQNILKAKQTKSNERKCAACLFVVVFFVCVCVLCEMWDTYSCMRDHHVAGAVVALLPDFIQPVFGLWIVCECFNHVGCVTLYGCCAALHSVW